MPKQSIGDQKRKSGEPYIIHPVQVAYTLAGLELDTDTICAALLHDVVEDSNITLEYLSKYFNKDIDEALRILTKEENDDYVEYIKRVKTNKLATKVKLKDLEHKWLQHR